jgi:hypothetical protein
VKRSSIAEMAWNFFRKTDKGPADIVLVFRVHRNEDGSFDTENWTAKHWLDDVGARLPPGLPGAICKELATHSVSQTVGSKAANIFADSAAELLGRIIVGRKPT